MTKCAVALAVVLVGCTSCRKKAAEAVLPLVFQRGWFELRTPAGFAETELSPDSSPALFELELASDGIDPLLVMVAKPTAFEGSAHDFMALQSRRVADATGLPAGTVGTAALGGLPAAMVAVGGERPDKIPVTLRLWGLVRDGQGVWIQCGGYGQVPANAQADCTHIIQSFRLTAPLPAAPPHLVPQSSSLAVRALGALRVPVPAGWADLTSDALPTGAVGGFQSTEAPVDGLRPSVIFRVEPFSGSAEHFAQRLEKASGAVLTTRAPLKVGPYSGVASQLELRDGAVGLAYSSVSNGQGLEVLCLLPSSLVERYRSVCAAMAAGTAPQP